MKQADQLRSRSTLEENGVPFLILKGDTTGKAMKNATLKTGFEILLPLFIDMDELIKVDTRTGKCVERAKKIIIRKPSGFLFFDFYNSLILLNTILV